MILFLVTENFKFWKTFIVPGAELISVEKKVICLNFNFSTISVDRKEFILIGEK